MLDWTYIDWDKIYNKIDEENKNEEENKNGK